MSIREGSSSNNAGRGHDSDGIDKLDYHPGRPLLRPDDAGENSNRPSVANSYAGSFFEQVAEGIYDSDRARMKRETLRYISFIWAIVVCLCAGSITAYSLYAPLFQRRLHYSQLRVNGISITAELAMYLPVPLFGYLCDRYGPGIPAILSASLFGFGYILAAFTYKSGPPQSVGGDGWPFGVMVIAFVGVGMATSCMYLSAVSTCAKNFGRGKHKGFALALPIAAFGLSGMWQSQIGSRLLCERKPDGSRGDVDVFRYFLFLGCLLLVVGLIGGVLLRVVDEDELIEEAVEELERSGLLEDSELFHRADENGYGTLDTTSRLSAEEEDQIHQDVEAWKAKTLEEQRRKTWLLNEETRLFLSDKTMWLLAAGFFLTTGPGEAFINNLGTIIGTFYPSTTSQEETPTDAVTHVSIVAVMSTVARILTGTLSDLLAPTSVPHQHRRGPNSLANSLASLPPDAMAQESKRFQVSRVVFLIVFCLLAALGQVLLASGIMQGHGERFWLVSASIGAGYGAIFSLTPIIVSVVWGVENFGTNWGIVATVPAIGATVWGLIYSAVYQAAADRQTTIGMLVDQFRTSESAEDVLCHGSSCYAPTFWAMAISFWFACLLWLWAWKGPNGWHKRGVAV